MLGTKGFVFLLNHFHVCQVELKKRRDFFWEVLANYEPASWLRTYELRILLNFFRTLFAIREFVRVRNSQGPHSTAQPNASLKAPAKRSKNDTSGAPV